MVVSRATFAGRVPRVEEGERTAARPLASVPSRVCRVDSGLSAEKAPSRSQAARNVARECAVRMQDQHDYVRNTANKVSGPYRWCV